MNDNESQEAQESQEAPKSQETPKSQEIPERQESSSEPDQANHSAESTTESTTELTAESTAESTIQLQPKATQEANQSEAKVIKRGLIVITAAKLWFILSGLILVFGLPYLLRALYGEEGMNLYGQYTSINNTLSILSMVLVTGSLQTTSKWVSQYQDNTEARQASIWSVARLMLALGGSAAALFVFGAPWLAGGRPELEWGYRLGGGVLLCYSLYGVLIGALNGRKDFVGQAKFDIAFATLKVGLIAAGVILGLKTSGIFGGFALATLLILIAALVRVGLGPRARLAERRPLYVFAGATMLYTLIFNMIFKIDIVTLTTLANEWSMDSEAIDKLIAVYGMNLHASRLPWQVTIAATFVIFPLLSKSTFEDDREKSLGYIRQTLRYLMILVGVASAGLIALPQAVSGLLPASYSDVTYALVWCGPAYFFFTLFNLNNTLLMSAGRAVDAMIIGGLTLVVVWGLYQVGLPWPDGAITGSDVASAPARSFIITRVAQATLIAFIFGFVCGVVRLRQLFGEPLSYATCLRVLISAGAMVGVSRFITTESRPLLLLALVGLAVLYFVVLTLLGEWSDADKARFKGLVKRS